MLQHGSLGSLLRMMSGWRIRLSNIILASLLVLFCATPAAAQYQGTDFPVKHIRPGGDSHGHLRVVGRTMTYVDVEHPNESFSLPCDGFATRALYVIRGLRIRVGTGASQEYWFRDSDNHATANAWNPNLARIPHEILADCAQAAELARIAAIPTLQNAIASGIVTAEFNGTGGSSGDSVMVQLTRGPSAGSGTVEVSLPVGSVLRSSDGNAQSMMVVGVRGIDVGFNRFRPTSQIVLTDSQPVAYVLSAYCIQFEKENPSYATKFTLELPDPVLACIAKKGLSLTVPALQAAVWMRTDNITYEHMSQKFRVSPQDWAAGQSAYQECQYATNANPGALP